MSYGIEIRNNNNRTIIDENNGILVVDPTPNSLPVVDSGQGNVSYRWRTFSYIFRPSRIPIVPINNTVGAYTFRHGLGTTLEELSPPAFLTVTNWGSNTPTTPYPVRYVLDSSDYSSTIGPGPVPYDTYGLRISKGDNSIVFDSSFTVATVIRKGLLISGQDIDIPNGSWFGLFNCPDYPHDSDSNANAFSLHSRGTGNTLWRAEYRNGRLYFDPHDYSTANTGRVLGMYFVVTL